MTRPDGFSGYARVLPDIAAVEKTYDYGIPVGWEDRVRVGTIVRVVFGGRRVGGWVVAVTPEPATDRPLRPLAKVSGWGPPADIVDLAGWAAWRWAGRRSSLLRTASPLRTVSGLPPRPTPQPVFGPAGSGDGPAAGLTSGRGVVVERLPPSADRLPLLQEAARTGDALILAPSVTEAAILAAELRRAGHPVALMPDGWARAAAGGCTVVGARAAAWAPVPDLAAVVVLDEHDTAYQEERAPTWNARDVALERARRAGVPCRLVSPCPTLEALGQGDLIVPPRSVERGGWPLIDVIDRRPDPPGAGLYSSRLVEAVREAAPGSRVVCVLNRKGRSRLLACGACGELTRCELCTAAMGQDGEVLACPRCGTERPVVCAVCGSSRLKVLRVGVTRAREELELLAGRPVAEVTGDQPAGAVPSAAVLVGTEAVLHRVAGAHVVAFLDFDQELVAVRYRAAEAAMALLARAARIVGGRDRGGRVVIQTRMPDHEVLDAARHADPGRLSVVEAARRAALLFPPETAMARLSGAGAGELARDLAALESVELSGPAGRDGDSWLVRAPDHKVLGDALAAVPRPAARVRIEVDPLRA